MAKEGGMEQEQEQAVDRLVEMEQVQERERVQERAVVRLAEMDRVREVERERVQEQLTLVGQ